jgi:tetratricopeptide (TPR) repeat protein
MYGVGSGPAGFVAPPPLPPQAAAAKSATSSLSLDLFSTPEPAANSPLSPLDLGGPPPPPVPAPGAPPPGLGFTLEIDGGGLEAPPLPDSSAARPLPIPPGVTPLSPDDLPKLAPVTSRPIAATRYDHQAQRARKLKLLLVAAGVVVLAGLGAGGYFVFLRTPKVPPIAQLLGPLAADVQRDNYGAYGAAAEILTKSIGDHTERTVTFKSAAAELWLTAALARGGDRALLVKAEQAMSGLPNVDKPPPQVARARALLALSKGKGAEVPRLLGFQSADPEGQIVMGVRDLLDGKNDEAGGAFRSAASRMIGSVLPVYLRGRALEDGSPADAVKVYKEVLTRNPTHYGAQVALARLESSPAAQQKAAEKLLAKSPNTPPGELAEAHVALGRALQGLGRSADAQAAFLKGIAADPSSQAANMALGESYLYEGRYDEALQRFRNVGLAGQKTIDAKFGLGGAQIATGKASEGIALIQAAAKARPRDPRGLYWTGFAAERKSPPALDDAAQSYRSALKLDAKFLPATLRLAALLQSQGKAVDAVAVLHDAEQAGAPGAALQVAFGEALILTKEPVKAEQVLRKAVAEAPKLMGARLALASALESQNKLTTAREVLEKALAVMPEAIGVRDRLARVMVSLGQKDQALDIFKAEIATGKATPTLRVAMAKLALDIGRPEDSISEMAKLTEENPAVPGAYFTLARAREAKNDTFHALQDYRLAQRFDSTPAMNLAYARALLKVKKEQEAMTALELALTLEDGRLERGQVYLKRGDYERALADFAEAAKLAPHDPEPLVLSGRCQHSMGQDDKAAQSWRAALQLQPDSLEANYWLGRTELDRGRAKAAVELLHKAAAKVSDKDSFAADLFFQLGQAEVSGGSKGAALAAFKRYLELAPEDATARDEAQAQINRLGGGSHEPVRLRNR